MKINFDFIDKISNTKIIIIKETFKLMTKENFSSITITQICQEANIARSTFYINFNTKEAIIVEYLNYMIRQATDRIIKDNCTTAYTKGKVYFEAWILNKDVLRLLIKNNLTGIMLNEYSRFLDGLSTRVDTNEVFSIPEFNSEEVEYFNYYNAAGLLNLLLHWASRDFKETTDEMALIYSKIIKIN